MPIAMSKDEWDRIVSWTNAGTESVETLQKREYIQYLHETSRAMTKSWPNSLENVNKRNEELRRARVEAAEQANANFYKKYIKRKKQEQQRLLHSARDVMFKNKDTPKMFLRAVIETVTQKEREEQMKFLQELRRQAALKKQHEDEETILKAKEWNDLMETKKHRRFEVNKQHQKEILDQAMEVAERNMREYETELNLQKIDNIKADEQMAAIKKFEQDFKAAEKARIFTDMQRSRQEAEARKSEKLARERMDERLLEVLRRSRARIDNRRKRTEKEIQEEKLRVLEKISLKLETGDAAREAKEQEILQKAVKEREQKAEALRREQSKKQQQLKKERVEVHQKFLRDEQQRLHHEHTTRTWDLVNRFKNVEIYEDYLAKHREEKEKKTKEYREDLLRLWKEREEREARERTERLHFYGEEAEAKLRDEEQKTLAHAALLLEEAKRNSRPQHALLRAVERYCKQQRLYPLPPLPNALQKHFPLYAPEDRARCDSVAPAQQRDGLDDHGGNSNAAQEKTSEQDYKRRGPANGMQRKNSEEEISLPPIEAAVRGKMEGGK